MKHMKKLIAVMLTFVMAFAMAATVFAADATTKITVPDNGHTYEVYQIFKGKLAEVDNEKVLSDIEAGQNVVSGIKVEAALDALKNAGTTDKEKLKVIKNYVNLNSTAYATLGKVDDTKTLEATVEPGYYLIKDKNGTLSDKTDAYTTYIVKVAGIVAVKPKSNVPTSEKKVKDINDSKETTTTGWQDSADYDIGDKVPFQLKGTVADNFDDYTVYKYVFHDEESAGLTFDATTVKVFVDGKEIPAEGNYSVETPAADGDTFDISFTNLKGISKDVNGNDLTVTKDSVITVEYESELNTEAVIGSAGNPNEMHLEFSNNPNDEQGGETGKTPDDKVIVFTYKTVINKTDENNEPLSGATFKLEKFVANKTEQDTGTDEYQGKTGTWVEKTSTTLNNGTTFSFKGLDDGYYRLTETEAPATYNKLKESIYFEISAAHVTEADNPTLTALSGNKVSGEISFTKETEEDALSADVVNKKGANLPETGGMGTTIFYIVGAILIIGAGVLMITRRRMSDN